MSEVVCIKSQEEYEDDFEKDLDWLISEEGRSEAQGSDYDEIEAEIDKELEEEDEELQEKKRIQKRYKKKKRGGNKAKESEVDEERWPSPMEPLEYDSDTDSPSTSSTIILPPPKENDQPDEEKKYILEKIQQANQELQDQEAPDFTRRRRLHFKDKVVDLVVSPLRYEKDSNSGEVEQGKGSGNRAQAYEAVNDVSMKLSELKLSPREGNVGSGVSGWAAESGVKETRVLVEKDGKFDLVNLNEVENQGLLPPIAKNSSHVQQGVDQHRVPRPPAWTRNRPRSANHSQRGSTGNSVKRRVQSATGSPYQATYTLSPQQKELLQRSQERKGKLAREAEQRKCEEEEQKRQENELAFKVWLMKKREQFQEEKRILRAQEMERMNLKRETSDPQESFRLWLQRKQEQQQKERQLMELKKLEQDSSYLLHNREDCERAFKLWLRRKQAEKRAEQQAAREHSRRLVLEERHARRMRDLLCTEDKPFRFTEQLMHHF